uniref:Uncharacterized protein n=1 Tax=Panagrolaimus davidi TaxID=227884 RepID=A0A914NYJ6_9BILA
MEPRPVAPAEPPKQFPVIKPNVAPEPSEKPSPFATNAGVFNFAQNQAQKPLFPTKPALPTAAAAAAGSPAQPTETKSIFGNTGKPFSFANAATPAPTPNPFAPASIQSQQPAPPVNQQKSLFTSPFTNTGNTPISFTPATGNTAATPNKPLTPSAQQNEHEENENPEEYVPDAHYEPVIPLPDKVDVVTGEESEQVLFKNRCKLYIFNSETKEVKERGVGDLKVLYNPEEKSYRVVMRREQVHKICANFRITKGMNIADKTGTNNCGIFNCVDFTDNNETGTPTVFIIRFREDTTYEEFKKLFNDISEGKQSEGATIPAAAAQPKQVQPAPAVAEVKKEAETKKVEGFSDKFNKKEGEWDCQTCYVRNKPEDDACLSCGTGKDGKEKSTSAPTFKPTTFSSANTSFSFGLNNSAQKPLFGTSTTTTPAAPSPAKTETQTTDSKPAETKSLFGTKPITFSFAPPKPATTTSPFATQATGSPFGGTKSATDGTQPKSLFGGSASSGANKTPLSFSSFASGTSFLDKKTDSPNTSFGAQTSSTFANKDKDEHEENENPEEYVPDAHYEPVIPLPDKVDVVTGEESEQVLFKNRCKLYIFNSETKEVKERVIEL